MRSNLRDKHAKQNSNDNRNNSNNNDNNNHDNNYFAFTLIFAETFRCQIAYEKFPQKLDSLPAATSASGSEAVSGSY